MLTDNTPDTVEVRLSLRIEDDPTVPVQLVQVAVDPDNDVVIVVGTNWATTADGARAIAHLLGMARDAIGAELVKAGEHGLDAAQAAPPKRPRFNPQPRKQGGK